ncbi:MAG: hypothetical protein IBJ10_02495 [Phycisphaerales bacterium]|nr:hypothetical protein [Phycisphaerales bacterium]
MARTSRLLRILLAGAAVAPAFLCACARDAATRDAAAPAALQAESAPPASGSDQAAAPAQQGAAGAPPASSSVGRRGRARVPLYPRTHEAVVSIAPGAGLVVVGHNGPVVVEAQERPDVFIEATVNGVSVERSQDARIGAGVVDGALHVAFVWPGGQPEPPESGTLRILLPMHASGVQVRTRGVVTLVQTAGDAVVRTAEGDVLIRDHRGAVDAETTNGRVTIERPGGVVAARTTNGVISITDAPSRVVALTSNAGIDVRLNDLSAGPVRIETSNAVAHLTVGDAFVGPLTAETTRSAIEVGPGVDPASVDFDGPGKARFDFGGGEPSMIKTVRGGVRVSRRSP